MPQINIVAPVEERADGVNQNLIRFERPTRQHRAAEPSRRVVICTIREARDVDDGRGPSHPKLHQPAPVSQ